MTTSTDATPDTDPNGAALPVHFISHGGGPWPWMPDQTEQYAQLSAALGRLIEPGSTPRAILMISAHWEEAEFMLTGHARPPMVYDYSNFPEETYRISYPAPGAPWLAARVGDLLAESGIRAHIDPERGFDHGMFSPMAKIREQADIPVVQLSLKRGLDPQEHLHLGRAIAPLRHENVLIIGSGLSYHNLREFSAVARKPSAEFDGWLGRVMAIDDEAVRASTLADWERAPSARAAHPREEHLLPLMVAVGAAGADPATRVYHQDDFVGGISVSNFMFTADRAAPLNRGTQRSRRALPPG